MKRGCVNKILEVKKGSAKMKKAKRLTAVLLACIMMASFTVINASANNLCSHTFVTVHSQMVIVGNYTHLFTASPTSPTVTCSVSIRRNLNSQKCSKAGCSATNSFYGNPWEVHNISHPL
jgi:hypothetical protein